MPCTECNDTGVIDTGNNEFPCGCAAGDKAVFNTSAPGGMVTVDGARLRHLLEERAPPPPSADPATHIWFDGHEYTITSEMDRQIMDLQDRITEQELAIDRMRTTLTTNAQSVIMAMNEALNVISPGEEAFDLDSVADLMGVATAYAIGTNLWSTHEFIEGDGTRVREGQLGRIAFISYDSEITIELSNDARDQVHESSETLPLRWTAARPNLERTIASPPSTNEPSASWHDILLLGDDD